MQGADIKLEIGAYPWHEIDWSAPVAPTVDSVLSDGAKALGLGVVSLVALSLY